MKRITRKSEIARLIDECLNQYNSKGFDVLITEVNEKILSNKVKFPLLEFCAETIYAKLPSTKHLVFCDRIESLKTEGGNVLLGIILQKRLSSHFKESISKAAEYISKADIWYVCDIIGERVFGYSLLSQPKKTIPEINKLINHETNWVIRSLGAGIHYAVKKGLDEENAKITFELLLSMANSKDKEIRQGVGWAAKTTAKFHPSIIEYYRNDIENVDEVANWFRKKIEIGLNRGSYAKRN